MKSKKIEFIVADAPDLDYNLTQEAWLNEQLTEGFSCSPRLQTSVTGFTCEVHYCPAG